MRAGVARGVITPPPGVELGGYPYFERANTGAHDPLVAAALFLSDQERRVLVIATDLFWITRRQSESIRLVIHERLGIDQNDILITCSHTHSAPWMSVVFEAGPGQPRFETRIDNTWIDDVRRILVEVAVEAAENDFEASLGFARTSCGPESGIGGNRRDPDKGITDTDVPVLTVHDATGQLRGIWTRYSLHPTILHGENTLVSADFPGSIRSRVAQAHPEAVLLYSMGAAGDQSPRYFRNGQGFDEVERFGRTIGDAVLRAIDLSRPTAGATLRAAFSIVHLVVKNYDAPEVTLQRVEELREREAQLIAAGAPYRETQTANLWLLGAECDYNNALQQADGRLEERYRAGTPYTVHALVVGATAWVFLPGEIFVDFAQQIRARSPFVETHVVSLTNGELPGYCVTQEALKEGGYEPGNSILAAESGQVMVDAALELLNRLSSEQR